MARVGGMGGESTLSLCATPTDKDPSLSTGRGVMGCGLPCPSGLLLACRGYAFSSLPTWWCVHQQLERQGCHTWPEWHRGRPRIAVWVHYRLEKVYVTCSCLRDALTAPGQRCIAEFALFSLTGGKGGCRCMAWVAQIAHRHRCVDALGPRGRVT